jgi:hypothetical protein
MIWRTDQNEKADKCFFGAVLPARTSFFVGIWDFVLNEAISTSDVIQRLKRVFPWLMTILRVGLQFFDCFHMEPTCSCLSYSHTIIIIIY